MTEKKKTTFEHNADGSTIVKLVVPVKFGDDGEHMRCTIPAIRGKHMSRITFKYGENPAIGKLVEFAAEIVEPVGIVDEMHPVDANAVALEVNSLLGKSLRIGDSLSP